MTTRESAIKGVMESMNHLYGLMDDALDFNETHVAAAIKTVGDIVDAGNQYLLHLYELQRLHLDFEDVLQYTEEESA